ncbi:MAG: aldo/keto reductase [bacterium]|nr:aldo/keto reductase [bacterium]
METRQIGSLNVTIVGLGCNNFGRRLDAQATAQVVHAALDAGINFFDTADIYGGTKSEEFLGQALGTKRRDVVIATKFGHQIDEQRNGAKPAYIRQAVEDSLRRLGTDVIDLYQLHRPDPTTPIADTLGALDDLVKAGKVREIGCSNFDVAQLREAESVLPEGAARFVSLQNELSLFHHEPERDVLAECADKGTAFLPYFPLANGLLTGKYRLGQPFPEGTRLQSPRGAEVLTEENLTKVEKLIAFAESRGHTLLELAFSWLTSQPVIASVIAGATKPEQIKANAAANWQLTPADFEEIKALMA